MIAHTHAANRDPFYALGYNDHERMDTAVPNHTLLRGIAWHCVARNSRTFNEGGPGRGTVGVPSKRGKSREYGEHAVETTGSIVPEQQPLLPEPTALCVGNTDLSIGREEALTSPQGTSVGDGRTKHHTSRQDAPGRGHGAGHWAWGAKSAPKLCAVIPLREAGNALRVRMGHAGVRGVSAVFDGTFHSAHSVQRRTVPEGTGKPRHVVVCQLLCVHRN